MEGERPFEREVRDRLVAIEELVKNMSTSMNGAAKTTYQNQRDIIRLYAENQQLKNDIAEMQAEQKWLKHTILAAIITGIVGIGILYLKIGLGL